MTSSTLTLKTRKDLPCFGYLKGLSVDVSQVLDHLTSEGLLNPEVYNDIKVSANSNHKSFVIANKFNKDSFFKEESADSLEGEFYKQLYLTDFDTTKTSGKVRIENTTIFKRMKRLDSSRADYLAEADELNYGIKNKYAVGALANVLDKFQSKITRVRLAYLKGHFEIKPHVDYDPSYITRYHVPLVTNPDVQMFVERSGTVASYHMPADGRVYFFNSGLKHWVKNNSEHWRLHLIVDTHGQQDLDTLVAL